MFLNTSAPQFAPLNSLSSWKMLDFCDCSDSFTQLMHLDQDNWAMKIQLIFSLSVEKSYHGRAIRLRTWTKPRHLHTVYIVAQSKRETFPLQLRLHVMGGCWERFGLVSHCWVWTGWARLVYDVNVKRDLHLSTMHVYIVLFQRPSLLFWHSLSAAMKLSTFLTQQLGAQAS